MAGSWYQLLSILREGAIDDQRQRAQRPYACPNDGEPLKHDPKGQLFCPYDGWRWPQDAAPGDAPG